MGRRIVGWLLVPIGSIVFALAAFLAWATWNASAWFHLISPQATAAAALGGVAATAGLMLLGGRPAFLVALVTVVGFAAVVLAADLFARSAGTPILGDADGWQWSEGDLSSSLAPAWALMLEGLALIGLAFWSRRPFAQRASTTLPI
jgi:hypothetical protein